MSEKYADIIQKLLAKAESTNSEAEAQALYAKAMELMTKHSITEAMLAAKRPGEKQYPMTDKIVLGRNGAGIKARRNLLAVLARLNGCQAIMSGDRATIYVAGFNTDVEATFKLFSSIDIQMARALRLTGERNASYKTNFMYGYVERIAVRLAEARRNAEKEQEEETPGTALVLRDRSVEVASHVRSSFGPLRGGPKAKHSYNGAAVNSGRAAADRADIGNTRIGGSRGELGQ